MSEPRAVVERAVGAPVDLVYRLIADFDRHHPRFLSLVFSQFRVEEGPRRQDALTGGASGGQAPIRPGRESEGMAFLTSSMTGKFRPSGCRA